MIFFTIIKLKYKVVKTIEKVVWIYGIFVVVGIDYF